MQILNCIRLVFFTGDYYWIFLMSFQYQLFWDARMKLFYLYEWKTILVRIEEKFSEEILINGDEFPIPRRVFYQNLKSDICTSWQPIVRTGRGSKATINVKSASRGGLELFYARGGESRGWRDARSCALRRIRARAPRSTTRLHNRYPAYTCASPRVYTTCVRARKKVKRVCFKDYSLIFVAGIFVSPCSLKSRADILVWGKVGFAVFKRDMYIFNQLLILFFLASTQKYSGIRDIRVCAINCFICPIDENLIWEKFKSSLQMNLVKATNGFCLN